VASSLVVIHSFEIETDRKRGTNATVVEAEDPSSDGWFMTWGACPQPCLLRVPIDRGTRLIKPPQDRDGIG